MNPKSGQKLPTPFPADCYQKTAHFELGTSTAQPLAQPQPLAHYNTIRLAYDVLPHAMRAVMEDGSPRKRAIAGERPEVGT
jgi:hypothetical protein